MTNKQEREFRDFLSLETWDGLPLTEKAVDSRVAKAKKVEETLGISLEDIVVSDERMRQSLIRLRENDPHRVLSNALRKYYKMRRGKAFPQIREGEYSKATSSVGSVSVGTVKDCGHDRAKAGDEEYEFLRGDFKVIVRRFHRWLIEEIELTRNSADQYKSYLKKLCSAVNDVWGLGWFESLPVNDERGTSCSKLVVCSAFIEFNIAVTRGVERKTWKDWRSVFRRFEEFLNEMTDFGDLIPGSDKGPGPTMGIGEFVVKGTAEKFCSEEIGTNSEALIAVFTHEELVRIFIGRLKTQSRYYPKIKLLFPTRLLTKIFRGTRGNEWIRWLKDDIESMHVLTGEGEDFVPFGYVKCLEIRQSGEVNVLLRNGASFLLHTHTGNGRKVVKMVAKAGGRDISIDHIESLESTLRQKKDQLPGLKKLTELFDEYKVACMTEFDARAERTWVKGFWGRNRKILESTEIRDLLKDDLKKLDFTYELMGTKYNSKKGNRN